MASIMESEHYVYILRCRDGSLYTGWTTDLAKRVKAHNDGRGAKYTKSRRPVRLAYFECFDEKIPAQKREREIKKLSKAQKESLVLSLSDDRAKTVKAVNERLKDAPEE